MKKIQSILLIALAAVTITLQTGCNGLGKMEKKAGTVKYEVTPNPLELHGDSVAINIKATYPPKYFAKKVALTVTPSIRTSSGDKDFKSVNVIGEKLEANGAKINAKEGGSVTYTDKIAYTPEMRAADVVVKIHGAKGNKTKDFAPVAKIADATITTPLLVKHDEKVIYEKDAFQRITPVSFNGKIYYPINVGTVSSSFSQKKAGVSNKTEFNAVDSIVKGFQDTTLVLKGVSITGNASPDGKIDLNTSLAEKRANSTNKYLFGRLNKKPAKPKKGQPAERAMTADSSMFSTSTNAEDWPGFKAEMEKSDIGMKDVILRVVDSNSDPEAREMEIKKMGKAYTEIAERILPRLRKSDIVFNAEKTGRSDEQIAAMAISSPDSLTVEELLYAGKLAGEDLDKQVTIYTSAERIYPQDYRTANNLGVVMFMKGDREAAQRQFEKANQLKASNAIVSNNMGAYYSSKGDRKKAMEMYNAASGAGSEVGENLAALDILNGNYSAAVGHCSGANTFNCALAKLLNGDKDGAMSTLNASPDKDSAIGHYLMAVISARKDDASGVVSHLQASGSKDSNMKTLARDDREFVKWFNDANFKAAVQ